MDVDVEAQAAIKIAGRNISNLRYADDTTLIQFSSVAQLCPTPCHLMTAAHQASLSITNSRSLLKFMSIKSVMPSNHLILCRLLLLPASIFPSLKVFSDESALHNRWPKYWSFSFSITTSNEYLGLISSKSFPLKSGTR